MTIDFDPTTDPYAPEVAALEEKLASVSASDAIVFYGSSSIRFWFGLPRDFSWTRTLNVGFGGATLAGCAYYFSRLVAPLRPAALVVYAGDNDLAQGATVDDVFAAFTALRKQVRDTFGPIPFTFLSLKPSPARQHLQEAIAAVNERIAEALRDDPDALFVDVYHPMLDPEGWPRPELYTRDQLHLRRASYELWRDVLFRSWEEAGFLPRLPRLGEPA